MKNNSPEVSDSLFAVADKLHKLFPIVEPNYVNVGLTLKVDDYRVDWTHNGKRYSLSAQTSKELETKIIKVIERYDNN